MEDGDEIGRRESGKKEGKSGRKREEREKGNSDKVSTFPAFSLYDVVISNVLQSFIGRLTRCVFVPCITISDTLNTLYCSQTFTEQLQSKARCQPITRYRSRSEHSSTRTA